jgi:hypothetical protein
MPWFLATADMKDKIEMQQPDDKNSKISLSSIFSLRLHLLEDYELHVSPNADPGFHMTLKCILQPHHLIT